jgi:hypothetical protein
VLHGGEISRDQDGRPRWVLGEDGLPVEDWSALSDERRRHFLWRISTHLFEWELAAADPWLSAMSAKVQFEEAFAQGFINLPTKHVSSGRPTIEDRAQAGHFNSFTERYFAIYQTYVSKMSDALVRSMIRIQKLLESSNFA